MHPYPFSQSVVYNNKYKKGRKIGHSAFGVAYSIFD